MILHSEKGLLESSKQSNHKQEWSRREGDNEGERDTEEAGNQVQFLTPPPLCSVWWMSAKIGRRLLSLWDALSISVY